MELSFPRLCRPSVQLCVIISLLVATVLLLCYSIELQKYSATQLAFLFQSGSVSRNDTTHVQTSGKFSSSGLYKNCEEQFEVCSSGASEAKGVLSLNLGALSRDRIEWQNPIKEQHASVGQSIRERVGYELRFKDVLLIVCRMHYHNLETLQLYRHFFWDIFYIAPPYEHCTADCKRRNLSDIPKFAKTGFPFDTCKDQYVGSIKERTAKGFDYVTFSCVAKIVAHLLGLKKITPAPPWDSAHHREARNHLKGVFVIHGDFWLTPEFAFAQGMDFSKVWVLNDPAYRARLKNKGLPGNGPPAEFIGEEVFSEDWFARNCRPKELRGKGKWIGGKTLGVLQYQKGIGTFRRSWPRPPQAPLRNATVYDIRELPGFSNLDFFDQYCFGWVDAYYLPRNALEHWIKVMTIMTQHPPFVNEIAVPLAFQALRFAGCLDDARQQRGCSFQNLKCWGSCCEDALLSDIEANKCGHRINHQNKTLTRALQSTWQQHKAKAETKLVQCYSSFNSCMRSEAS